MVLDVTEGTFHQQVIERSSEVPVVVDFWAEWCGPCRQLGPALEKAAHAREGKVDLAKLDVDANQRIAQAFHVQGIPAVKAFKDGRIESEFTGAIPPAQVEAFFDRLVPSEAELAAEEAVRSGDEAALRAAVEADPRNTQAATALARILIARGDHDAALELLEPVPHDFTAAGLASRAWLAKEGVDLDDAFDAWDAGDHATALEKLQEGFAAAGDSETRDRIRQVMVAIFTELGADHELAREHRRRLATALY
ncbi:MAG: putative thioredoxin [Thermoleophilaceae bacterium]|jgi:putative thioredoxin|nr:putative thioredoxin [Thermoleophilaceae bacterium]